MNASLEEGAGSVGYRDQWLVYRGHLAGLLGFWKETYSTDW